MAWTKSRAGTKVIQLLKTRNIILDPATEEQLKSKRHGQLFGYNCMVANVMSLSTFRVRVNQDWFHPHKSDRSKPRLTNTLSSDGFDFQLIPTKNNLYALYYLKLLDYTLRLEFERKRWFKEPWWGIRVNEDEGTFVWEGGNTILFPLTPFCSPQTLLIGEKHYLIEHEKSENGA